MFVTLRKVRNFAMIQKSMVMMVMMMIAVIIMVVMIVVMVMMMMIVRSFLNEVDQRNFFKMAIFQDHNTKESTTRHLYNNPKPYHKLNPNPNLNINP